MEHDFFGRSILPSLQALCFRVFKANKGKREAREER